MNAQEQIINNNSRSGGAGTEIFSTIYSLEDVYSSLEEANKSLDDVELQLVDEVSNKAGEFFSSTSALHNLSDTVVSLQETAASIQELVESMHKSQMEKQLALQKFCFEQKILMETRKLLGRVHEVSKSQMNIKSMLDTHAFSDALRLIDEKITIINKEFSGIKMFESISVELQEMRVALTKMLKVQNSGF